ncbi:MAG: metal-dependent transcriptional regulator [Candidatus Micrarchaeia archaeon]
MQITKKERECLVAVKELSTEFPVRLVDLAKRLVVKPPTALRLVRRLKEKGLVVENRGSVLLTEKGVQAYRNIMLAHRTLEYLLSKAGISKECACKEASKIDYLVEPSYARRLWAYLGKPANCPHGKPIIVRA